MTAPRRPSAIVCADWGKEAKKRAVYVADVSKRAIQRVAAGDWSLARVLGEAERWTSSGSVLATFDAPLGVPLSYATALAGATGVTAPSSFLELLTLMCSMPNFFDSSADPGLWTIDRPFFSVPPVKGGLRSYATAAARQGVELRRAIDVATGAKSVFIRSGIPGSVGSAACALWQELAPRLTVTRRFRVWPFEGDLPALLRSTPIVLGEIYPRAAYATALLDEPAESRRPLVIAKTKAAVRCEAIALLRSAGWHRELGVTFENLIEAETNEDDFDACLTAIALLRCVLEGVPLSLPRLESSAAEGGILGTGGVNLDLRPQAFPKAILERRRSTVGSPERRPLGSNRDSGNDPEGSRKGLVFYCPIEGCQKVFNGSRSGWDGHVGSKRLHPDWHPELERPEERKRRFEEEFPGFFK